MEPTLEKKYKRRIAELEAENAALKKRVADLEAQIAKLSELVVKLNEQIAQLLKNSRNIYPPSRF